MEMSNEERFERAMKLSQRAGVSLEDAKAALTACDFDMLDAMVYLEKLGKASAPKNESYTTHYEKPQTAEYEPEEKKRKRVTFGDLLGRFFKWCGKIIKIGNENYLEVDKHEEHFISIPLTIVVLFLIFAFWFFVPLMIVGLFCGFRYGFSGPLFKKDDVFNNAMNRASNATESIKKGVQDELDSIKKDREEKKAQSEEEPKDFGDFKL